MNTNYIISAKDSYIHVRAKGLNNFDKTLKMWLEIIRFCEVHQCYNILGETIEAEKIDFRYSFDMVDIFKRAGVNMTFRIAWVNHALEVQKEFNFMETVLKNRCMVYGHLFNNVEDAQKWILLENENASAG